MISACGWSPTSASSSSCAYLSTTSTCGASVEIAEGSTSVELAEGSAPDKTRTSGKVTGSPGFHHVGTAPVASSG
eukprot:3759881-Amphidinium_carterae.1